MGQSPRLLAATLNMHLPLLLESFPTSNPILPQENCRFHKATTLTMASLWKIPWYWRNCSTIDFLHDWRIIKTFEQWHEIESEKAYWKRIIVFACRQSNLFIMTTSLLTSFISYQNMAYFKHSYVGVNDRLRFFLDRKNIFGRNRYFSLLCFYSINNEWLLQT